MNELLVLEVMLSRMIAQEASDSIRIMFDPFALSMMTVNATVQRLQAANIPAQPLAKYKTDRKDKIKLINKMIRRILIKLETM